MNTLKRDNKLMLSLRSAFDTVRICNKNNLITCFIVIKTSIDVSLPKHWRVSNQVTGLRIRGRVESQIFLKQLQRVEANWKELCKS